MKEEFSNWYRKSFGRLSADPGPDVWKNISSRLDQQQPKKKQGWKRIAFWFFLPLCLSSSLFFLTTGKQNGKKQYAGLVSAPEQTGTPSQHGLSHKSNSLSATKNAGNALPAADHSVTPGNNTTVPAGNTPDQEIVKHHSPASSSTSPVSPSVKHTATAPAFTSVVNADVQQHATHSVTPAAINAAAPGHTIAAGNTAPSSSHSFLPAISSIASAGLPSPGTAAIDKTLHYVSPENADVISALEEPSKPFFYYGISATINNSWLLNDDTYYGLRPNTLNETQLYFRPAIGLQAGYSFSPSLAIESQFIFDNYYGQIYSVFDEGMVKRKEVIVQSQAFGVNVRKGLKSLRPYGIFFNAGTQLLFITKVTQIDDGIVSYNNGIKKISPLVAAGAEYDLPVIRNWQFAAGLRATVGLNNIYHTNGSSAGTNSKTYLSGMAFYISANRISQKK